MKSDYDNLCARYISILNHINSHSCYPTDFSTVTFEEKKPL